MCLQKELLPRAGLKETSTWLTVAITGSLLLALQGCPVAGEVTETRLVAAGSSVLMSAPSVTSRTVVEWEFIRNATPEFILQYYLDLGAPTVYAAYQGRVVFYPENCSLLLQGVREADSGIYKATVDLKQNEARKTLLEVIQPVPQPELQSSSNLAGSPINLTCVVPKGMVDSISWKKEGLLLSPEKCFLLSGDIFVLSLIKRDKSDCGSYSCNVSNRISWKEATLNLTVTGLPPLLHYTKKLVVVALMFSGVSAAGFIFLLCRLKKLSFEDEKCEHIAFFIHVLLCVSSLLLLATSIIWMLEEGPSSAFIILGLFLSAMWIGSGQAAAVTVLDCFAADLSHLRSQTWYRAIYKHTIPTTLVVNLLFSIHLLHNIQQLHDRGCSEPVELLNSFISAAATIFLMFTILLLWEWWGHGRAKSNFSRQRKKAMGTSQVTEELRGRSQEKL